MNTFCRKSYNAKYYADHRERILSRREAKDGELQPASAASQLSLFECSTPLLKNSNARQRFKLGEVMVGFLVVLVVANSLFLLSEAVEFYRSNNASTLSALVGAVFVELLLLALSGIQPPSLLMKLASRAILVLLYAYSSWSFCSSLIGRGYASSEQMSTVNKQIERLENAIQVRNRLISENIGRQRITMAHALSAERDKLNQQLSLMENQRPMASRSLPATLWLNTWSQVLLRLLVQISNIILVHHLSLRFRKRPTRSLARLAKAASVIHLRGRNREVGMRGQPWPRNAMPAARRVWPPRRMIWMNDHERWLAKNEGVPDAQGLWTQQETR